MEKTKQNKHRGNVTPTRAPLVEGGREKSKEKVVAKSETKEVNHIESALIL